MTETQPDILPDILQNGGRIRELRKERLKLNGTQFAGLLGIYPQSLTNIEKNKKPASLALMVRIARQLHEPLDSLLRPDAFHVPPSTETKAAA